MTPTFRAGLIAGFILGAAVTGLAFLLLGSRPELGKPRPATIPAASDHFAEAPRLAAPQRAEPEKPKPAPPSVVLKQETPAERLSPEVRELFTKLAEIGLAAFGNPKFTETLHAIKAAGKPAVEFLMNTLRTSTSATERFLAAALLEGAADPTALPALADALQSDKDDLVRRMASHGLALLGVAEAEASLRAAATGDIDWGVRVNSAYGLAKLNSEDGLRMLREAYESIATPAEYRLAVLGGLADVAAPSTAPLFRRILADTQDATYLLLSIGALEKMKDAEAVPALQRIVSSTQPDLVKQRAGRAIESIEN
jgi:HEAT repeat protein